MAHLNSACFRCILVSLLANLLAATQAQPPADAYRQRAAQRRPNASTASLIGPSAQRPATQLAQHSTAWAQHDYVEELAPTVTSGESILIESPTVDSTMVSDLASAAGCNHCGMNVGCCCSPAGYLLDWSRADLWAGVTGFSGPANIVSGAGANGTIEGSFGFHEGFNFGSRLPSLLAGQMGSQLGLRFTHTHLDGSSAGADRRSQLFLTAGLFRRVDYGLQGGLVVDYLHDDWIYQADLVQLRGELSFLMSACHDIGFRFTDSQQVDDTSAVVAGASGPLAVRLAGLNNYRFFYRYRFGERGRGVAELQAGFTEESEGVVGFSLKTPLQNQLGLETTATYLIPSAKSASPYMDEGWNLGMAIVWTPGRVFGTCRDYYRPLFDVADNGSFLVRMLR